MDINLSLAHHVKSAQTISKHYYCNSSRLAWPVPSKSRQLVKIWHISQIFSLSALWGQQSLSVQKVFHGALLNDSQVHRRGRRYHRPNLLDENVHKFYLATWLRLVKFKQLNISKFLFLSFNYISYHCEISKNMIINGIELKYNFNELAISKIANSNKNFLPVGITFCLWIFVGILIKNCIVLVKS